MMENFFGIMKSELLYTERFESSNAFVKALEEYIEYYNNKRIKNYWCPVKLFCVPKIKVGFLAWNPTFFVTFVFVTKPK